MAGACASTGPDTTLQNSRNRRQMTPNDAAKQRWCLNKRAQMREQKHDLP